MNDEYRKYPSAWRILTLEQCEELSKWYSQISDRHREEIANIEAELRLEKQIRYVGVLPAAVFTTVFGLEGEGVLAHVFVCAVLWLLFGVSQAGAIDFYRPHAKSKPWAVTFVLLAICAISVAISIMLRGLGG